MIVLYIICIMSHDCDLVGNFTCCIIYILYEYIHQYINCKNVMYRDKAKACSVCVCMCVCACECACACACACARVGVCVCSSTCVPIRALPLYISTMPSITPGCRTTDVPQSSSQQCFYGVHTKLHHSQRLLRESHI